MQQSTITLEARSPHRLAGAAEAVGVRPSFSYALIGLAWRPATGEPATMRLGRRATRAAALLGLGTCSGCADLIEGFLLNAAMAGLIAVFVPAILVVGSFHLACGLSLRSSPDGARAFGRLATAWLVLSTTLLVAVGWLQIEFPQVGELQGLVLLPASTLLVGFLSAYTSSRLAALDPANTDKPAVETTPIGLALRIAIVAVLALPVLAAAGSGPLGERLARGGE